MRAPILVLSCTLGACGISIVGVGSEVGDGWTADAGATDAASSGDVDVADGSLDSPAVDVSSPPDPTKVTVSYAIGKNQTVYAFDVLTSMFKALPSGGCPTGEETAVLSNGYVYVTASSNQDLYRLTTAGCTPVKTGSNFPYALGTAPVGTLSATEETLVGYMGAGDYVKVDKTDGKVTVIGPGALGSIRPSGDVTAIGTKGYLAAATGQGSCPSGGDCIVEVNLLTGAPVGVPKQLTGYSIYGLAHSKGQLLLYANGAVYPFDIATSALGASLASFPSGADFSGAAAPPYPGP